RLWAAPLNAAPFRAIDAVRRPLRALRNQRRAVRADGAEVVGIFQAEVQRAIAAHAQPADETPLARCGDRKLSLDRAGEFFDDVRLEISLRPADEEALFAIRHQDNQWLNLSGEDQRISGFVQLPRARPIGVIPAQP